VDAPSAFVVEASLREEKTMKLALIALAALGLSCSSAPSGDAWTDLMPPKDLKGFVRVPIKPLADKPVFVSDGSTLVIDGVNATEMLLTEGGYADGVFRVEWRWRKHPDPKAAYNGGIYVRTAADGKTWVQAQVARQEKSPVVGDLFADLPAGADGKPVRVEAFQKGPSPEAPLGDWNVSELACKGRRVTLSVNGKVTAEWTDCPFPSGRLGLQAEFGVWEVRSMKFRAE
jgi:hypothetical protein